MTKKKMVLNDDWSISDPEVESRRKLAIETTRERISSLKHTKHWLLDQLNDIEVSIQEEKETLKCYGVEE